MPHSLADLATQFLNLWQERRQYPLIGVKRCMEYSPAHDATRDLGSPDCDAYNPDKPDDELCDVCVKRREHRLVRARLTRQIASVRRRMERLCPTTQ